MTDSDNSPLNEVRAVPFAKASACGNDFLIIDGIHAPADMAAFTRRICERHDGVGADGVEWLFPDQEAEVRARLFNADGSEAEISGNGTRCVAAYWIFHHGGSNVRVRTGAGMKHCRLLARAANRYEFETSMGEPEVGEEFSIKLAFREVTGIPVSMGNPHFVVFVGEFAPGWQAEAAEIGRHHDFKYGINVELVKVQNEEAIDVRFFERGVGETRSSGTGSSAAAAASLATGRARSPLDVVAPGGTQRVRLSDAQLYLQGPAEIVCTGDFFV